MTHDLPGNTRVAWVDYLPFGFIVVTLYTLPFLS
jgi:hypothetical protein